MTVATAAVIDDFENINYQETADGFVEVEEKPEAIKESPMYTRPIPSGPTYFTEPFDTRAEFLRRWVYSQAKKDGADANLAKYDGMWSVDEATDNPIDRDLGLILKSKAKHHAISSKLDKVFEFDGKPLIVQYEVKFQRGIDCGGAYIKLLSKSNDLNLKQFTDKTPYTIMFGPDKCGNDHKVHFIFRHRNPKTGEFEEKHAEKPTMKMDDIFTDRRTHLFTLIVRPDNTYEMRVDKKVISAGSLLTNFSPSVNPPQEVDDPDDLKPEDWDNREKIPDLEAKKPVDWDETEPETIVDENALMPLGWLEDEEMYIPDPDAVKPDDWDDIIDGEWEPPLMENPRCKDLPGCGKWEPPIIANPKYKGVWSPPMIDNPNYRGEWIPKKVPNPNYFEDGNPYNMTPIQAVGLELWSMTDNILFDNFIIADNATVVEKFTAITWDVKNMQERRAYAGLGFWAAVLRSAEGRPWLWVVYSLILVVPILLLFICFCPRPGQPRRDVVAYRKKFDYPMPDVRDPIGVIKEEDEHALKEVDKEPPAQADQGGGEGKDIGHPATVISTGANLISLNENMVDEGDLIQEVKGSPKISGSPRKRATRKE
ncbi:hypothetical protein BsWGS_27251 [Bradybaena similaris]